MNKLFFAIAIFSACLFTTGCTKYRAGNWSVTPATQTAEYDGEQFTAYVGKHADSTPEKLHIVSEVNPKPGAKELPKITGALTDTLGGGKRLDIYVETEQNSVPVPVAQQ